MVIGTSFSPNCYKKEKKATLIYINGPFKKGHRVAIRFIIALNLEPGQDK